MCSRPVWASRLGSPNPVLNIHELYLPHCCHSICPPEAHQPPSLGLCPLICPQEVCLTPSLGPHACPHGSLACVPAMPWQSRPPGADHRKDNNTNVVLLPLSMFIATTNIKDNPLKQRVKDAQQKQMTEMELWCDTQGVRKLPEGYAKDWRLAVPSGMVLRCELLVQFHNLPTAGHPGSHNTITLIAQHYWWPGMNAWVERYIAGCAHCQQSKICTTKKKPPPYCIPSDPSMWPFNVITLDLITQLPKANGHDAILTIVDQGCSRATTFIVTSIYSDRLDL